jgi:DNA-binding NtrC family response regulator
MSLAVLGDRDEYWYRENALVVMTQTEVAQMPRKMNFETVPLTSLDLTGIGQPRDYARPTILVVDDEAVIADTLGMILELKGFRVAIAYDGNSALKLSRTIPPDLLLTDVAMPGMNGIDLAVEIQQSFPNCKILLFSGQASTSDLLGEARHTGRDFAILSKPLHPTKLLTRVSDALATRTAHGEFANKHSGDYRESLA